MEIHLNMYQTLAVAVLVLFVWQLFKTPHPISEKFCIPAPVIGGLFVCNFDLSLLCYRNCGIFF